MQFIRIPEHTMCLITASAMWDGINTSELVRQPALFIADCRVKRINSLFHESQAREYPEFKHIHFPNLTLLPGLVDAHVHLALDGTSAGKEKWHDLSAMAELVDQNLRQSISSGVLAVRDAGDRLGIALSVKQKKIGVSPDIPMIKASGPAITRLNGYGQFLGAGLGDVFGVSEAITALRIAGADQVKVLASGIVSMNCFGKVGGPHFSKEEFHLIAEAARENGLPLMVHANSEPTISNVISAGVKSIEHGYFINLSSLNQMAETKTAWVPTVFPVAAMINAPEADPAVVEKTYRRHLKMISVAQKIGVKLAVGTDAGSPGVYHGRSYIEELRLWAQAGMPLPDILKAATATGAMVLGLDQSIGTIQVGKRPALIGVQGNPLETIETLADIKAVLLPQDYQADSHAAYGGTIRGTK